MNRFDAYRVFLALSFGQRLAFYTFSTMSMVYQVSVVGLNPLQLVLVGTVVEASYFLFEIPTGVVADVYSRRLSILIGLVLTGISFIVVGAIPHFETILLAQVIWGMGATFLSGATQAWIADEWLYLHGSPSNETSPPDTEQTPTDTPVLGQVYIRGTQAAQLGALTGIVLSTALASIAIQVALVVGGCLYFALALILAVIMPEDGFQRHPQLERQSWQALFRTTRQGVQLVRKSSILLSLLIISVLLGAWSEGFDRLWTKHLLDQFTLPSLGALDSNAWFGIIHAIAILLTLGLSELLRRVVDTESHRAVVQALFVFNVALTLSMLTFIFAPTFTIALIALWIAMAVHSTYYSLYATWINFHATSDVRATIFSIEGQADSLGQVAGGPAIGAIGTLYTLRAALTLSALILVPVSWLYRRIPSHQQNDESSS